MTNFAEADIPPKNVDIPTKEVSIIQWGNVPAKNG